MVTPCQALWRGWPPVNQYPLIKHNTPLYCIRLVGLGDDASVGLGLTLGMGKSSAFRFGVEKPTQLTFHGA